MPVDSKPLLLAAALWSGASLALAAPEGPPPDFAALKAQHDRDLATVLHVTSAQAAAFHAYAEADAPPPPPPEPPPAPDPALTTPQALDRMAAMETERRAHIEHRIAATRALYAVLTPDQRQTFDALMRLRSLPKPSQPHRGPPGRPPGGPPPMAPH